jgi:hypothetical protein
VVPVLRRPGVEDAVPTPAARATLPLTRPLALPFRLTHAVATLALATSIAGLLYGPRGWWYDPDPATLPAFLGQDAMMLLVGVPLLVSSAWLASRGSLRGTICWMGAFFYVAYSYYFHVVGGRFTVYFPLYIALVSMGTYGALAVLFSLDLRRLEARFDRPPAGIIGAYFTVTALAFAGLWLSVIEAHVRRGTPLDPVARAVIAIDGVVLLPLLFFGGRALRRRDPLGLALAGLLLVKTAATLLTLIAATWVASRWGRPLDWIQTGAYVIGFAGAAVLLGWYLRAIRPASVVERFPVREAA